MNDSTGAVVAALMVKMAAPAVVTEASDEIRNVPNFRVNFADDDRQYPIHTPAAAWASAALYHAGGRADAKVASVIEKACHYHRISGEWDRLVKAAAPAARVVPSTAKGGAFALPTKHQYPIDTPEQITKAAAYFERYAHEFPYADRKAFAVSLVKAASGRPELLGADALARLEAEAGYALINDNWKQAFEVRARIAERDGDAELAAAIKEAAAAAPEDAADAAAWLRAVDQTCRWQLADPLEKLAGLTPSQARAKLDGVVETADGAWYKKADLDAVPDETLAALFGAPPVVSREYRAGLLKNSQHAAAFRGVLTDHGVKPVQNAKRQRPDWQALAG